MEENSIRIPKAPSTPAPPVPKRNSSRTQSQSRESQIKNSSSNNNVASILDSDMVMSPDAMSATFPKKKERRSVSFSRDTKDGKRRESSKTRQPVSKSEGNLPTSIPNTFEKVPDLFAPLSDPPKRQRSQSRGRKSTRDIKRKESTKQEHSESTNDKELPNVPVEKENIAPLSPIASQEKVKTPFDHVGKTTEDFKDHVMKIIIHAADALESNLYIRHPLVRISFIDMSTGKLLAKSQTDRKITFSNESKDLYVILPVMTHVYNFTEHRTKRPNWEETVVLNEDYLYLLRDNVVVVFEILDFITSSRRLSGLTDGWYKIAWGFLKLLGADQLVNTESKVRLQLYKYPFFHPTHYNYKNTTPFYKLINGKRVKYPSTLYVTIHGIPRILEKQVKTRSRLPTESEIGRITLEQLLKGKMSGTSLDNLSRSLLNLGNKKLWRYEKGFKFQLPNHVLYYFDSGVKGAFSCSFSNNGLYLAIASIGIKTFPIKVYDVLTGERVATLEGHQDLVYKMHWSPDDSEMISASSDSSVRIWSFESNGSVYHTGTLPHSTFVYSAVFHPGYTRETRVIATAAFDGFIRIWSFTQRKGKPHLLQTLKGHSGHVNALVFDDDGSRLYSADSNGIIKIWETTIEAIDSQIKCCGTVDLFTGIPLHSLSLHTSKRKLLVHTSFNTLHILDTRILRVLTHIDPLPIPLGKRSLDPLKSSPTPSLFKRSDISPCGTWILSGSNVYHLDSGKKVGSYDVNGIPVDVLWHPKDFTCCIVEYGCSGVHVYTFDDKRPPFQEKGPSIPKQSLVESSKDKKSSMDALNKAVENVIQGFKKSGPNRQGLETVKTVQAKEVGI